MQPLLTGGGGKADGGGEGVLAMEGRGGEEHKEIRGGGRSDVGGDVEDKGGGERKGCRIKLIFFKEIKILGVTYIMTRDERDERVAT